MVPRMLRGATTGTGHLRRMEATVYVLYTSVPQFSKIQLDFVQVDEYSRAAIRKQ